MNVGSPDRIYVYFIDREGDWWCDGWPVDDHALRDELSTQLTWWDGRLHVRCEDEVHPVAFEIAPLFVRDVDCGESGDGGLAQVTLRLLDGRELPLDGASLRIDDQDRLFCAVTDASLPALFTRPAYYRLMRFLEEDAGGYYLEIGGTRWNIGLGSG